MNYFQVKKKTNHVLGYYDAPGKNNSTHDIKTERVKMRITKKCL